MRVSLRRALELDSSRKVLPTGSSVIDELLGGGLKTGEMVEVFGASNTGKTQLAMQAAVSAAAGVDACVYIDTEGQFRPERLSSMCAARGIDAEKVLRSVYLIRAESVRRQTEAVEWMSKDSSLRACRLVVIDTLTKNFSLELAGPRSVGRRQTALGAYLNRLARDAYLHDRAILLLNRVASVGTGAASSEVDIGGQTVRHFVRAALHLQRRGTSLVASLARPRARVERTTRITEAGLA